MSNDENPTRRVETDSPGEQRGAGTGDGIRAVAIVVAIFGLAAGVWVSFSESAAIDRVAFGVGALAIVASMSLLLRAIARA